jgi:DNA replication protein DnaC
MIIEDFNIIKKEKYFAVASNYEKKNGNETLLLNSGAKFIRESDKDDDKENIKHRIELDAKDEGAHIISKFLLLPPMMESQRHCVYNAGQSGGGKTYLVNDYVKLYKVLHPKNQVLFFTLNNADADKSLTHQNYKFVDMQAFCDVLVKISNNLNQIQEMGSQFKSMLLIFDDVGNLKNNKKAQSAFWNFIDQASENMRKHKTSVFVIGHTSRLGKLGTIIKEELTHYVITGQALQTVNDSILKSSFNWTPSTIDRLLLSEKSRWVIIDTKKRIIIKEKSITLAKIFIDEELFYNNII